MSVINTNVNSLVAQQALTVNARSLNTTMEQLSTGKRINSAKDDAAGFAISNKMTSQIRGLDQAVRNANDGISMLQTADGAMTEVTNMMQRMRELGVQSANDSNTGENREYLDLEFQQLKGEIDRIIKNTQWNGVNVLDKSFDNNTTAGKFIFQVGANSGQTISHTIDVFDFGSTADAGATAATGATAAEVTSASVSDIQASSITVSDDFEEGDVITVNLNENIFQYSVTSADAGSSVTLSTSLSAALSTRFDDGFDISVTGGGVVEFTLDSNAGTTTGNTFSLSSAVTDGEWDDLEDLEVSTQDLSNDAMDALDASITKVNKARAEIGAVINRLTYAVDNLTNISGNASASRSRIEDTDYAKATTTLARSQIIQQAATAMLAQANQQPQTVLSLLK
jgi:flagellin